ncbi:MAG: hypothetical protein Q7T18_03475, partial [Sedimentisphaerales bacterium]|nr:hypothetical protein [Sedimentisphaerales bacterium]
MKTFFMQKRVLCLGVISGLALFAGSAHAALLNIQILGHAANSKGEPDQRPPAYMGAGVIGAEGDYWNGVVADVFGQPLKILRP